MSETRCYIFITNQLVCFIFQDIYMLISPITNFRFEKLHEKTIAGIDKRAEDFTDCVKKYWSEYLHLCEYS